MSTQFHVLRKYRLSCYFQRPFFQRPLLWSALAPCFIHLNLLIHAVFCVISLSCNSLWSRDWYAFQGRAAACDVAKMGSFAFVLILRFSFSTSQRFLQAVWHSSASSRCSLVLCCSTVDVCDPTVHCRPGKVPLSLPSLSLWTSHIWFIHCSIQSRKTEMIFNPSLQVYSSDGLRVGRKNDEVTVTQPLTTWTFRELLLLWSLQAVQTLWCQP